MTCVQSLAAGALALGLALAPAGPARADAVTDALEAALAAYRAGDLPNTAAQVTTAGKAVQEQQAARLAAFLPPAPEGWSMESGSDAAAGLAMMGMAGTVVEGRYNDPQGNSFTLTLTADSPMVATMAGVLGNPQMMAMMGKVVKVGGTDMMDQSGSLSALVGGRVLVQAQGMESAAMIPVLSGLNFAALPTYDK